MSMPTGNSNKISVGRGYTFPPPKEDYIIKKYKDFNNSSKVIDDPNLYEISDHKWQQK